MKALLAFLVATSLWAGNSLLGTGTNNSIAGYTKSTPIRIEFYLHDWGTPSEAERVWQSETFGGTMLYSGTNLRFIPFADGVAIFDIPLALFSVKQMYVRLQRDPTGGTWTVEAWDAAGARQYSSSQAMASTGANIAGHYIRGASTSGAVAFWRAHSTLVALNSTPPTTYNNTARIAEWKFDNSLTASAGGNDLIGSVTYPSTPGQVAVSVGQVNPTSWSNQTSMRAGFPATLTGTASYSQADSSATVTCFWTQVSGPSIAAFANRDTCTPTVTGLIFGSYTWRLTVTDIASATASSTIEVGAVATDEKGVVIPADPNTTKIFGEMIAFGKSPWEYMDDRAKVAVELNQARYAGSWPPAWANNMAGTISTDLKFDRVRTTLSADITISALTINVTSAAGLDLTTFPTIIGIGGFPSYSDEEVLICSAAGNVLTVCFDGRGYSPDAQGVARAWTSGTNIYQRRVAGSSSAFLTNFCSAGAGWPGTILYNTGTVRVTAGSTTITLSGIGATWTAAMNGAAIRIQGTHSGGTPFVFHAYFTRTSGTGGTLSRAYPSGADTNSGRSYHLISNAKYLSMNYRRAGADATIGRAPVNVSHCETNTVMYWRAGVEYLATMGSASDGIQTAITYSGDTLIAANNSNSYQYYDEVAAGYALYFRSGWEPARTQARTIGDYWITGPNIDDGYPNVAPRNRTLTGPFIGAALDGRTANWYGLRRNASIGAGYSANCYGDLRETSFAQSWTSLAAFLDPDSGQRATWVALMPTALAWDDACKGASNSYPQYYSGGEAGGGFAVNAINGSNAVTGTSIPASYCPRVTGGTASIVSGQSQITGASASIASGPGYIVISGTSGGNPLILKMQYSGSGTTVALAGVWPGDTGTINFQTEANSNVLTVSPLSVANAAYGKMYACTWNSSTSITLIRNYEGPTGTAYLAASNLVGVGTQPFIGSIKAKQQKWAVEATSGATQTSYSANLAALSNWVYTNGLDPVTGGMYYGVNFAGCSPKMTAAASDGGYSILNAECSYWPNTIGKQTARPLLAEGASALVSAYEANPTAPVKAVIDQYYANLFGQSLASGVPSAEGAINNEFLFPNSLTIGKWYGFHFGMGMAHQWPAVRLGGVAPADDRTIKIPVDPAAIARAASVKITLTRPSSATSICTRDTAGYCTLTGDGRQGDHQVTREYWSGAGATGRRLASSSISEDVRLR